MIVPSSFEAYHRRILGNEYGKFLTYFFQPQERFSLRVNTLKSNMRQLKRVLAERGVEYGPVSWCSDGLWAGSPNLDYLEHQLGLYYIQSASSMIAPQILGSGARVLDMCAAPGGKSTHLAQLMGNRGLLVANEDSIPRIRALIYNLQRCGVTNAVVTRLDGCRFNEYGETFDRILIDAPCSSVGTLRHSREVLKKWSLEWVRSLAKVQKMMIIAGFDCLQPGGKMVYSTCTTTSEENEQVIEHLLAERNKARIEKFRLDGIKLRPGLSEKTRDCARVWPQDNDTEPHFIAKVTKDE